MLAFVLQVVLSATVLIILGFKLDDYRYWVVLFSMAFSYLLGRIRESK